MFEHIITRQTKNMGPLSRYVPMFGETEFDTDRAYPAVRFEEQHQALAKLQAQGKIREIAISNETPYGLMRFCEVGNDFRQASFSKGIISTRCSTCTGP